MSNFLYRAALMLFSFGYKICCMSKFWGIESAKVVLLAIGANLRPEPISSRSNTKKSISVIGLSRNLVFFVQPIRGFTEIANSVIGLDCVDVVNRTERKAPIDVHPCKLMPPIWGAVDSYDNVPLPIDAASKASALPVWRNVFAPSEDSCFWGVVQKFVQAFCGKIGLSHDAPCQQIGQRSGSAETRPVLDILSLKAA